MQLAGTLVHDAETVVIHRRACAPYSDTIICNLNLDVTISQGLTANVNVPRAGMLDGIEHCLTDQLQDVDMLPRLKIGIGQTVLKPYLGPVAGDERGLIQWVRGEALLTPEIREILFRQQAAEPCGS